MSRPLRPIVATTENETIRYTSATEAGRAGFCRASVVECLKGRRKTHGGRRWRYATADDYVDEFVARLHRVPGARINETAMFAAFGALLPATVPNDPRNLSGALTRAGFRLATETQGEGFRLVSLWVDSAAAA